MPGQPNIPGTLIFDMTDCQIAEVGGLAPSVIVNVPNPFNLNITLQCTEPFAPLLAGDAFNVVLHAERLEDGGRTNLSRGPFTVPATVPGNFNITVGPFTTGPGADFQIAPTFVAATFEITVHIHFSNAAIRPIVAGFFTVYMEVLQ